MYVAAKSNELVFVAMEKRLAGALGPHSCRNNGVFDRRAFIRLGKNEEYKEDTETLLRFLADALFLRDTGKNLRTTLLI